MHRTHPPTRTPTAAVRGAAAPAQPGTGTSLYVHVPFCVVKCGYCDFTSYATADGGVHDLFLRALDAELGLTTLPVAPATVFLGGGTPTYLDPARFAGLFAVLGRHVDLRACREVTIEANPESVTDDKIAVAVAHGVNRASMGVQSFAAEHLRFLDRAHTAERAVAAFAALRAGGVTNASLDLIFGLPGQTLAQWDQDLQQALALGPDHLSCYNLTFEPGTRLHRDLQRGRCAPNDDDVDRSMFLHTRTALQAAGFHAYEISNFAGRGGPCRHNDHYWLQGDYVGIGPGASSHRAGVRHQNLKAVEAWARAALSGQPPVASAETLSPVQRIGEALWLGIRRTEGISVRAVERRIGAPLPAYIEPILDDQRRRGWVEFDGDRLHLTAEGLLVADPVGGAYLAPSA